MLQISQIYFMFIEVDKQNYCWERYLKKNERAKEEHSWEKTYREEIRGKEEEKKEETENRLRKKSGVRQRKKHQLGNACHTIGS